MENERKLMYRNSQYPTLSASIFSLFVLLWCPYLPCQRYGALEASSQTWASLAISSQVSTSSSVHSTTHIRAQWNVDGREPRDEPWHVGMLLTTAKPSCPWTRKPSRDALCSRRDLLADPEREFMYLANLDTKKKQKPYHESTHHWTSYVQQNRDYTQRESLFRI